VKVNRVNWPEHCEERIIVERVESFPVRSRQRGRGGYQNYELLLRCQVCGREGTYADFAGPMRAMISLASQGD
jgi:hypothetical protein